jgi:hypothetical protein
VYFQGRIAETEKRSLKSVIVVQELSRYNKRIWCGEQTTERITERLRAYAALLALL